MGMAEDSKFSDGYEAIFKKKAGVKKPAVKPAKAKVAKKPAKKK